MKVRNLIDVFNIVTNGSLLFVALFLVFATRPGVPAYLVAFLAIEVILVIASVFRILQTRWEAKVRRALENQ